jgi:hypothetical protein
MATQTADLFLLDDLENVDKTRQIEDGALASLRSVAGWIRNFVAKPHGEIGRAGPVCPFVQESQKRKTLWLAPEHVAGRSVEDVVRLVNGYKTQLLHAQPVDGDVVIYKCILIVFTDLPADRAKTLFGDVLKQVAVPSYVEDGIVLGPFYENNEATAIYNRGFRPFTSPVPFLLLRPAVISDWKFFLEDDDWLNRWGHRYGESAVRALAEELRRLPWRAGSNSENK